ncbi:deoxycytidine deaminase [Kitasatospora sp. NPDC059795]|uniref:dCTP deaminase n=1 Tax=Kitasatospora sp. NPDC059795 TaxID=3346949 RepID=UPI00365C340E
MILTGPAIRQAVKAGDLTIDPYLPEHTNPNSHGYRLGGTLKVFTRTPVDPRTSPPTRTITIPERGYRLRPGRTYLGSTVERIGSDRFVTSLIGRSSVGRLGLFTQIAADLAQLGAVHQWTLEIVVTQPLKVYPGMVIGQVSFWDPVGERMPYSGYYGTLSDPSPFAPHALAGGTAVGPSPEVYAA